MADKGKMLTTAVNIVGTIDPSLQKMIDDTQKKIKKFGPVLAAATAGALSMKGAFDLTKKTIALTATATIEAGTYLANLGSDWQQSMNQLSASTGATGDELAALGDSVKAVYQSGFGEGFSDVAEALAEVQKVSGLAGDELELATESGFALADTFGYEVGESARAASAMIKNFGISAKEAYGLIATGAQNGADKNGDMLDTLNEYSSQFAALGLSADQFVGTLVEGADAGLFSIDKVGDAVKEFNIRAKDGSDTSREAFESLGLNADTMFSAFAAGGETAEAAFFDTVTALNNMDDPLARNAAGVALFGTQFEDLGAGVLPVLAGIETAAYDGAAALQQINDVKYNDLGSAFESIKRSAEVALLPMASMIANTLTSLAPIISEAFETIGPIITELTATAMPFVQDFLGGAVEMLRQFLPQIASLAGSLFPILQQLMTALLPPILDLINAMLPTVMQILNEVIVPLVPLFAEMANSLLPPIVELISAILPLLTPILSVLQPIAEVLGTIVGWIGKVVGWVADGLGWVVDLFTGGASAPEGYATGGFTSGPSLAGEDPQYPTEAVISFNPAYRSQNLSYWEKAGRMLGATPESDYQLLSAGSGTSVVYDLSGLSFNPRIEIKGDTDEDALIRKLRDLEPEFIDFILEALARRECGAYVTADTAII